MWNGEGVPFGDQSEWNLLLSAHIPDEPVEVQVVEKQCFC